jgi:hypothetical protein
MTWQIDLLKRLAPLSPAEREKRILEALFPHREAAQPKKRAVTDHGD